MISPGFRKSALCIAVTTALCTPLQSLAQVEGQQKGKVTVERVEVTGTRRVTTVQETPLNITAIDSNIMADQNISELTDVARWVPGLTIQDQGGRSDSPIIVRGLNTNSSGPGSDAGTVATYLGEIPLAIDLSLNDVERIEVLIGPQGTLYGAGTLGGAIRYLPNKAELDNTSGSFFSGAFSTSQSDQTGGDVGFIFNTPIIDEVLGLRLNYSYSNDPGFIDYNYLVKTPGVSIPDPDFTNASEVDSQLKQKNDANGHRKVNYRVSLRWAPSDDVDVNLNYYKQDQKVEGRSIVHYGALAQSNPLSNVIGKYESAYRYEEPREVEDELLSLELSANLGFAELVSATGKSKTQGLGQRDQTDLLTRLNFGYEEFPAFSAFTREEDLTESLTQELRLVSTTDSALSWIVGAFYNKVESSGSSKEFTPGFDQYALNVWQTGGNPRPDALEYLSVDDTEQTEQAIFAELSYDLTEELSVTLGTRFYDYEIYSRSAIDLPLYNSVFTGAPSDQIKLDYKDTTAADDGTLLKFNASYRFTDDVMGYVTVSEGFRIGGANGVGACPDNIGQTDQQIVCALPDEVVFRPDTTVNHELGFKTSWLDNRFDFNASIFYVDWKNAQVAGATVNGQQPITANAEGANSKGIEIYSQFALSDEVKLYATYAYTKAKLTSDAPYLFEVIKDDPSKADDLVDTYGQEIIDYYAGKAGDRLPGSPETQFSFGAKYSTEILGDKALDITYGLTYQSDIYSKLGLRADGEVLPGYGLSNLNARLADDNWSVVFYVDNLFNKYAFTSVRRDRGDIGLAKYPEKNVNGVGIMRNYGHYLVTPRTIGLKFEYQFEL